MRERWENYYFGRQLPREDAGTIRWVVISRLCRSRKVLSLPSHPILISVLLRHSVYDRDEEWDCWLNSTLHARVFCWRNLPGKFWSRMKNWREWLRVARGRRSYADASDFWVRLYFRIVRRVEPEVNGSSIQGNGSIVFFIVYENRWMGVVINVFDQQPNVLQMIK